MGRRNTGGRLILIPLAMVFGCMRLISPARLAIHYPLSVFLFNSTTQRCICTESGRRTFGGIPLTPSIISIINPLNCPLETPEEADPAAGVGLFSAEGTVPNLLQKTRVAGILKVD